MHAGFERSCQPALKLIAHVSGRRQGKTAEGKQSHLGSWTISPKLWLDLSFVLRPKGTLDSLYGIETRSP
jgi:hypothetical protein